MVDIEHARRFAAVILKSLEENTKYTEKDGIRIPDLSKEQ